jgi:peptidylprolyl isomerase
MKLRSPVLTLAALALASGVAVAQTAAPKPAAAPAAASAPLDKPTLSYAIGYDMGEGMADQKVDVDLEAMIRALRDGYGKKAPAIPRDKLDSTLQAFQQKMGAEAKAQYEAELASNKSKSTAFLAANKAKPGVTVLPNGIQYKIIDVGSGQKPTSASTVGLQYRAQLISGREFTNTYAQPNPTVEGKVSDFPVPGVREVLTMMPVGSRWEVYLPADKAFGDNPRPIGPGQAVVFDIKLVSVK